VQEEANHALPAGSTEETEVERIAEELDLLTRQTWRDPALALVGAIPYVGGPVSIWLGQRQQREAHERVASVLNNIAERLAKAERAGAIINNDEGFAELVTNALPLVARTRSEDKRERYAALLVNAALGAEAAHRDEARTMSLLLDSLEFAHVALLDRLMALPMTQSADGLWGARRSITVDRTHFKGPDGDLLLRLDGLGLLDLSDFRTSRRGNKGEGSIVINNLGVRFHSWIHAPPER
jgi:hypothetical protein